jgi:TetR/AcrR family transcriptional regulator, cholesterol catabolism regulator
MTLDPEKTAKASSRSQASVPSKASKAELTRERILEAAAAVLAERGFAGTSLAEVADRAGTQPGSLYYHFASREVLIAEVLHRGVASVHAHVVAVLKELPADVSAAFRLETALRAHLEFVLEQSTYARAGVRAIGQVPPEIDEPIAALREKYGQYLGKLFRLAAREGALPPDANLGALRLLVLGAANWAAEWHRPDGKVTVAALGDMLTGMLFVRTP